MYIVRKVHEQWLDGNRKDAIQELRKLDNDQVREFMGYLSADDKATALILTLSALEQVQSELDYEESRG